MPTTVRSIGYSNAVQRLVWSGPDGVITAHLWGGGGGAGGSDAAGQGGNGSGSAYANYAFSGASYVSGTNLLETRTSPATPPV